LSFRSAAKDPLLLLQLSVSAVILSAAKDPCICRCPFFSLSFRSEAKDPLLLLQLSVLAVILSAAKDPDEPHFI
jgi:hypothetical protein